MSESRKENDPQTALFKPTVGPFGISGIGMSLSAEEKLRLTSALASLSESGLPYSETLRDLVAGLPDRKFRRLVEEFATRVDAGQSLDEAIEPLMESADPAMKSVARTVLRTRNPMRTFMDAIDYRRRRTDITRMFWLKLLYPVTLFVFTSVILGIVMKIVLNSVAPIFRDFGLSLPGITAVFLRVAEGFDSLGPSGIFLPGVLGVGMLMLIFYWFNAVLHKWHDLAHFCRTLAVLERSGNPLPESLAICGATFPGRLGTAMTDMAEQVRSGQSLAEAIDMHHALPDGLGSMVAWSNESGHGNAEGLEVAAALFEARGKGTSTLLSTLFTVFTVIFVVWIILLVIFAVYLPLTTFTRLIS